MFIDENSKDFSPEFWSDYYQIAWNLRANVISDILKQEGMDAFKAIERFERFEALNVLKKPEGKNYLSFAPKYETPQSFAGRPLETEKAIGESNTFLPTYSSSVEFILDILDKYSFDAIVELGAGYGRNLFQIHSRGGPQKVPYFAGEFTKSGVECINQLALKAPGMNLTAFQFDHNHPDLSILSWRFESIFVFTNHSIEQVQNLAPEFFDCVASCAKNVMVAHFEPFGYQFDLPHRPTGELSKLHREGFRAKKWNQNFITELLSARARGVAKLLYLEKNIIPGDFGNPTSVAIWRNLLA